MSVRVRIAAPNLVAVSKAVLVSRDSKPTFNRSAEFLDTRIELTIALAIRHLACIAKREVNLRDHGLRSSSRMWRPTRNESIRNCPKAIHILREETSCRLSAAVNTETVPAFVADPEHVAISANNFGTQQTASKFALCFLR
jgi:hypothetical protein